MQDRCSECGSELTDCGEMTIDGPSPDCPLCKARHNLLQSP
jgi:DNA-directed RNA polymerase subunit RPC12/RpoP